MKEKLRQSLLATFEKFDLAAASGEARAMELFEKAESIIAEIGEPELTSDDYYIWGLLYYSHPEGRYPDIELEKFRKAVELDPHNHMAWMYQGHTHFDEGNFQEAEQCFERVSAQWLQENYPLWRSVKLRELIAVCHLKLGKANLATKMFEEVLSQYERQEGQSLAWPREMLAAITDRPKFNALKEKMLNLI